MSFITSHLLSNWFLFVLVQEWLILIFCDKVFWNFPHKRIGCSPRDSLLARRLCLRRGYRSLWLVTSTGIVTVILIMIITVENAVFVKSVVASFCFYHYHYCYYYYYYYYSSSSPLPRASSFICFSIYQIFISAFFFFSMLGVNLHYTCTRLFSFNSLKKNEAQAIVEYISIVHSKGLHPQWFRIPQYVPFKLLSLQNDPPLQRKKNLFQETFLDPLLPPHIISLYPKKQSRHHRPGGASRSRSERSFKVSWKTAPAGSHLNMVSEIFHGEI